MRRMTVRTRTTSARPYQGLYLLVHYSAQRKHILWNTLGA
jgi:hypothetical protein